MTGPDMKDVNLPKPRGGLTSKMTSSLNCRNSMRPNISYTKQVYNVDKLLFTSDDSVLHDVKLRLIHAMLHLHHSRSCT